MAKDQRPFTSTWIYYLAAGLIFLLVLTTLFYRELNDARFYLFGEGVKSPYKELANVSPAHLSSDAWGYSRLKFGEAAHFSCVQNTLTLDTTVQQAQVFCDCYLSQLRDKLRNDLEENAPSLRSFYAPRRVIDDARAERRYCVRRTAEVLSIK